MRGECGLCLRIVDTGEEDRSFTVGQHFADDERALFGRLARTVNGFGCSRAQRAVMVDQCVANLREGKPAQFGNGGVGADGARLHIGEQLSQGFGKHAPMLASPRLAFPL